jgi:hypothetical protein
VRIEGRCACLVLSLLSLAGCSEDVEQLHMVLGRSSCEACHRPVRRSDGVPVGIEQAHPPVSGVPLTCVECHGGDPDARKQSEAHVDPVTVTDLRSLTVRQLDNLEDVAPGYLRFINPGDLRVAQMSCGSGAAREGEEGGCHATTVERVKRNLMATFAGELNLVRYRTGHQASPEAEVGTRDIVDPDYDPATAPPTTVPSLVAVIDPVLQPAETRLGKFIDLYITKSCVKCHLWGFGSNRDPGDWRSSGCSACHSLYSDDGFSESADPTVDKGSVPHPLRHELTTKIPVNQCTHCHYRGGRIGISYQGYREGGGDNPPANPGVLGYALHDKTADFYIVDEDTTNDVDETPPDLHFEAGMHCIDCHTEVDVHGDGHLYSDASAAVEIECEDCHGTAKARSTLTTSAGRPMPNLDQDGEGRVWLTGKLDGVRREVAQVKDVLERALPGSDVALAMGTTESGFSHTEELECYTCHSGWIPTCYGCHPTIDLRRTQISLVTGEPTIGLQTGERGKVAIDSFILMRNSEGRISPSMPAEKMFFTAIDGDGVILHDKVVRPGQDGQRGMGHRAYPPHTVRKTTRFGQCSQCHPRKDGSNLDRVRATMGFGTDRFIETDGEGVEWVLDRIVDPDTYEPTVLVGHPSPQESRPLNREEIERMMGVELE